SSKEDPNFLELELSSPASWRFAPQDGLLPKKAPYSLAKAPISRAISLLPPERGLPGENKRSSPAILFILAHNDRSSGNSATSPATRRLLLQEGFFPRHAA